MAKKTRASRSKRPVAVNNNKDVERVQNGLGEVLGVTPGMFGLGTAYQGTMVNQVNTLFRNNRWYLVSNMRQLLSETYCEHGLIQTIVNVPVDDALRGGIEIKSKQLSEDDIQQIQVSMDRDDDMTQLGWASKWSRLFGGGAILIMTDQDPMTPLNLEELSQDRPFEFKAVDMWELFWDKQDTEGYDPSKAEMNFEFYDYYGMRVHKSRVMKITGTEAPSFVRPRLRGWGLSVVEALVNSINQYLKSKNLTFEVLDEFKLDIFKIKNLTTALLSADGEQLIRKRVTIANREKNYLNALTMDSEDDYIQKQLSFSGLADSQKEIRMQIASDMRMPLSKLFGISATGFSSGEDDIEVYNSMVESEVRNKIKYIVVQMVRLKCQILFGFMPDDIEVSFKPLRVMSSEQEENVKTQKFNRLLAARQSGFIDDLEFREAANRGNLFDIKLDTDKASLNPDSSDVAAEDGPGADNDDPGANRVDTEQPKLYSEYSSTKPKDAPKPKEAK